MDQKKIDRINELARLAKERDLSKQKEPSSAASILMLTWAICVPHWKTRSSSVPTAQRKR